MIQHVHGSSHGLFWCTNLPGGTEENNKQSEAGKQLSGLRYESMYSKMKAGMDQSQVGSQGYHISRSCDRLTAPPEKWFADSKKSEKKSIENLTYEKDQVSHNPHMWQEILFKPQWHY